MGMLEEIISKYKSGAEFCRAVGIKSPQFLTQIKKRRRPIPPKVAVAINRLHGVPLHLLRPDIYPDHVGAERE